MNAQQDISNFAAFDLDDLLAEISSNKTNKKEVTAYLDRNFIINSINNYMEEISVNKQEFQTDHQIDFTEFNFTGADLRGFSRKDLEIFNFNNCDISFSHLDRVSLDFFKEYMINGNLIYQGIILDNAFLGPSFTRRSELGIECYIYLNLSNLDLTGSSFKNSDIDGLLLENSNISGCNFTDAVNLDPKQFAFSIGFENAIFSKNKEEDQKLKEQIKNYSNTLDADLFYGRKSNKSATKFINYLANLTNVLDD